MTEEQLKEVEHKAGLFFRINQLAIIIGLPEEEIRLAMSTPNSPLGTAIHRGRLLREAEVREAVFDLALKGSSPAQAQAIAYIKAVD